MPPLHSETMELLREIVRGRMRRWVLLAVFWLAIGVLSSLHWQLFFTGGNPYDWWELYRVKVALWYVWGLVTPVILWFGWCFPIGQGQNLRNLAFLLPISIVFTLLYLVVYTAILLINLPNEPGLFQSPRAMFLWVIGTHSTWYFLAFWATVGVEHVVAYYRRFHERQLLTSQLEAQLAEAQLAALRSQLQPHFLFNTLHSVMALIAQSKTRAATEMLTGLSDLLRHALEHACRHEVPLREELDILRQYIAIESVRFSDRLTVEWDIEPAVETAYVPSFILQPLAENAIRHGIEKRPGPGFLRVECRRDNGHLRLSFKDNGVGVALAEDGRLRNGHGLGDMRARLDVLYRSDYSLDIEPNDTGGTAVHLLLPYNERPSHQPVG